MESTHKKIRLLKFGSEGCGPCQALKRAKTLEKFAEKHPEVELEVYDVDDVDDSNLADEYDIQAIPAFVFESYTDEYRLISDSGNQSLVMLEKLYAKAVERLEKHESRVAEKAGEKP